MAGTSTGFGARLEALRIERGISRKTIAEAINRHVETVSRYARGETSPTVEEIAVIADLLGVSTDALIRGPEPLN